MNRQPAHRPFLPPPPLPLKESFLNETSPGTPCTAMAAMAPRSALMSEPWPGQRDQQGRVGFLRDAATVASAKRRKARNHENYHGASFHALQITSTVIRWSVIENISETSRNIMKPNALTFRPTGNLGNVSRRRNDNILVASKVTNHSAHFCWHTGRKGGGGTSTMPSRSGEMIKWKKGVCFFPLPPSSASDRFCLAPAVRA